MPRAGSPSLFCVSFVSSFSNLKIPCGKSCKRFRTEHFCSIHQGCYGEALLVTGPSLSPGRVCRLMLCCSAARTDTRRSRSRGQAHAPPTLTALNYPELPITMICLLFEKYTIRFRFYLFSGLFSYVSSCSLSDLNEQTAMLKETSFFPKPRLKSVNLLSKNTS